MDWTLAIGNVNIGIVDIIIFVICMISAVFCCIRGFVNEFSHHAGIIFGFATGFLFTTLLSPKLSDALSDKMPLWIVSLISFVILTSVGYIVFRLLGSALETIVESFHLGALNNILGFFWGLIIALFILSVIMYVLSLQHIIDFSPLFDNSLIANNLIKPLLPETISTIEDMINEL